MICIEVIYTVNIERVQKRGQEKYNFLIKPTEKLAGLSLTWVGEEKEFEERNLLELLYSLGPRSRTDAYSRE